MEVVLAFTLAYISHGTYRTAAGPVASSLAGMVLQLTRCVAQACKLAMRICFRQMIQQYTQLDVESPLVQPTNSYLQLRAAMTLHSMMLSAATGWGSTG